MSGGNKVVVGGLNLSSAFSICGWTQPWACVQRLRILNLGFGLELFGVVHNPSAAVSEVVDFDSGFSLGNTPEFMPMLRDFHQVIK